MKRADQIEALFCSETPTEEGFYIIRWYGERLSFVLLEFEGDVLTVTDNGAAAQRVLCEWLGPIKGGVGMPFS